MPTEEAGGPRESALAAGWTVHDDPGKQKPAVASEPSHPDSSALPESQFSNASVMLLGVFGGLYLLYTWGWVLVVQAYQDLNLINASASGAIGGILQYVLYWIIPFAPALWFVCALWMTRGKRTLTLALALVLGALVLIPLPVLLGGSA